MTDTDFEARLARALNAGVDARVGAERPAPPFVPGRGDAADTGDATNDAGITRRAPGPHRPRWNRLLLAAACVLVVAAAALALVRFTGNDNRTQPASPTPSPTSATPTPAPSTHVVTVGGARLALPIGWSARPIADAGLPSWCLGPAGTDPAQCATTFSRIVPINGSYQIDVNSDGGLISDSPQYCVPQQPRFQQEAGERRFGGRLAEWRRVTISCPGGATQRHEQYVVPTLPGYVLHTTQDYGVVAAAMTLIATRSRLPQQRGDAPLAVSDHGTVRSVTHIAAGIRVAVTRTASGEPGSARLSPAPGGGEPPTAVSYDIPTRVYRDGGLPKVGKPITIVTDGVRVTSIGSY